MLTATRTGKACPGTAAIAEEGRIRPFLGDLTVRCLVPPGTRLARSEPSWYHITMKTLYKKTVRRATPDHLAGGGPVAPDEQVTVYIEPTDQELAAATSLPDVMNIIGHRAQERGLTEEKLQEILNEESTIAGRVRHERSDQRTVVSRLGTRAGVRLAFEKGTLLLSDGTFAELADVLKRAKFDAYVSAPNATRSSALIEASARVEITEQVGESTDPNSALKKSGFSRPARARS